jgi:hypothetical protein
MLGGALLVPRPRRHQGPLIGYHRNPTPLPAEAGKGVGVFNSPFFAIKMPKHFI